VSDLLPFVIIGLVTGSVYGLAGVGLVLTYKTSGIFNFAYGALATVAAYCFYWLYVERGVPLAISLILAVPVLGLVMGCAFEGFAERVSRAKLATQVGATVGIFLVVEALATIWFGVNSRQFPDYLFPGEAVRVGGVNLQASQIFVFSVSVIMTVALYLFLRRARLGVAMRAVVDNPELINLAGTNPVKVRRRAWIIGCFFAALSGLLLAPSVGLDPSTLTLLVLDAFGAAALGGFSSLPLTWAGGIVLGLGSALASKYANSAGIPAGLSPSLPFAILFLVIIFYPRRRLLVRPVALSRTSSSWTAPRRVQIVGALVVLAILCTVPAFAGFRTIGWASALADVILLLSLGLLVRTSGQVSLCLMTFAAIGAVAFSKLTVGAGLPWLLALLLAGLVVVPIGALLAIPAIRIGGLFLALATFGFGVLVEDLFYNTNLMFGPDAGIVMPRPDVKWLHLSSDAGFYYVILFCTFIASILVVWIVRTRLGRLLRGMSDSTIALSANGTTVSTTHVLVFCISAYMAAIGGALLGMTLTQVNGLSFDPTTSIVFMVIIVISVGGEPWYALLSGAGVGLVPVYLTSSKTSYYLQLIFGLAAVQVGMFGTKALPAWARRRIDRFGEFLGESRKAVGGSGARSFTGEAGRSREALNGSARRVGASGHTGRSTAAPAAPLARSLDIRDLQVRFGGLVAVDGLNLTATVGRITGLIGPNGAGKTSTFNACSGFNYPSCGKIVLNGDRDISHMSPAARARLGLGRTFQQMELFDSLSVAENVALGREASLAGANVFTQVVSRPADRAEISMRAAAAIALCGIDDLVDKQASELSTGQRRRVELARALAGPFSLLLLDEPSSGLDRSETKQFGQILTRAVADFGLGVLLVEHDMSLVMDICEYIYVMDFGRLIFHGTPDQVRSAPNVQAAYLGSDEGTLAPEPNAANS
jgi:ABC-type branched-subunit amino acid transport system ATPase component/branched-subunit amino acid ABC-type transport system permease component